MNNNGIGREYEERFLKFLQERGHWATFLKGGKNGQPCDVIAIKNDTPRLIDVKHCEGERFEFKCIRPNQMTCFEYAWRCGNSIMGFAIWFEREKEWRWLPYKDVVYLKGRGIKSVRAIDCWKLD